MQILKKIRPLSINTNTDETLLGENEARFIKNMRIGYNANANLSSGTGDGAPQGANFGSGTPLQSTTPAAAALQLPAGKNQCIGQYECQETNELYWFNWNSNNQHGIYRLSGLSGQVDTVYVGACLNFSNDPKYSLDNRIYLKVVYFIDEDGNRSIKAKYLVFTEGYNWQRWLDVETSIATKSFNPDLFPYFRPVPPHFDPCDLIQWNVIPPFVCPTWELIPFGPDDVGKNNNLRNKSLQFAYQFIYTDGRPSVLSPYSTNLFISGNGCSELNTNYPRCARLTLEAGGPLVEKIRLLFRNCKGDWYLYDTIDKYNKCDDGPFYTRQIALPAYNSETNTFTYKFCGDKECAIFSAEDAQRLQNDLPIKSFALTPAGNAILLADNLYGYDNLDCETLSKIKLKVGTDPDDPSNCAPKNVTIKVAVTVEGCPIIRDKAEPEGNVQLPIMSALGRLTGNPLKIDQAAGYNFVSNKKGLIGYLAGTPYAAIGKQYKVDADGTKTEVGILNYYDQNVRSAIATAFKGGSYYISEFEFVVPPANYIFRLASTLSDLSDPNYQKTSTFVKGACNIKGMGQINPSFYFLVENYDFTWKEIFIDACNGDVDVFKDKNKLVLNFEVPNINGITAERILLGYITDTSEADKKGQELLSYVADRGRTELIRSGWYTDHNGFYFTSVSGGSANKANVDFWGEYNCQMTSRQNPIVRTTWGKRERNVRAYVQDIAIKDAKGGVYKACNEVKVMGKVTDQNGAGVSGVNVVITRGNSTLTNSEGTFVLKVHKGDVRGISVWDYIIFNSVGGCAMMSVDCKCIPAEKYIQPPSNCSCDVDRIYSVNVQRQIRYVNTAARSLKGGGRYGVAVGWRDAAGRQPFVSNCGYIDVPTFLERGNYDPVTAGWEIAPDYLFGPEVRYISFYITQNLNFGNYLQWVGDKIEFLNARGEKVTTTAEAVRARIYVQSLLDFNVQNNFATTVGYQFVPGDLLRIYDNGDGTMFKVDAANGFMDYPILGSNFNQSLEQSSNVENDNADDVVDGRSFIIAYDKRLDALKDKCGFWIEIQRPHQCESREVYYEICGTYPVRNGKLVGEITGGTFQTWDTYYQARLIRPKDCTARQINHPFESSSITDFWGAGCDSSGRATVSDPQAAQQWYGDDVISSDEFVNEGRYNGLGTFREKNRKSFKGQDWGAIVAMHAERGIIAVICQNDWMLTDYQMNYLRTNADGLIVSNAGQAIGDPHQKSGYTWGCEFEDNSTIVFDDGVVQWADRKNSRIVAMDYRGAGDLADVDNKSYFISKFHHLIQHNGQLPADRYLEDLIEVVAGKDLKYNELLITFRPRRGLSDQLTDFVNDERETQVDHQETFVFNMDQQKWVRFAGYTPERFASLRHSLAGPDQLISFVNGLPYFHNSNSEKTFNTFYGIETDQVVSVVMNYDPSKVKTFQSITVESNSMAYFLDMVFTEDDDSFSYLPLAYWKKKEGIWYAELLRNMNTYAGIDPSQQYPSMLIDGKRIFGQYSYLRFVRDARKRDSYNELNNIWVRFIGSEKSEK